MKLYEEFLQVCEWCGSDSLREAIFTVYDPTPETSFYVYVCRDCGQEHTNIFNSHLVQDGVES